VGTNSPPIPGSFLFLSSHRKFLMAQVQELTDRSDFDDLLERSKEQPVALLKHSVACPISAQGQKEFVGLEGENDPPLYAVVVQYARDLSNHIAETLGVRHETPQVLIIKDGEAIYHASHHKISTDTLRSEAQKVAA
jgi:bacillithiol system protein YtxJ